MRTDTPLKMEAALQWVETRLGERVQGTEALAGGAGARSYWRVYAESGATAVLMHAVPEEREILPPALRASAGGLPFVEVTRLLGDRDIPVPALLGVEPEQRWILLEDLGDRHLCDLDPGGERERRYEEAIDLLVHVHAIPSEDGLPFERCFDEEWVSFELEQFLRHGVSKRDADRFRAQIEPIVSGIAALPRVLALRDYQSQNLMIDASGRLRVLDYQDALLAPPELDLAALLWDSYVKITPERREALLSRYAKRSGRGPAPHAFALVSLHRKLKDYGRFRYLVEAKQDRRYESAARSANEAIRALLPELEPRYRAASTSLRRALERQAR